MRQLAIVIVLVVVALVLAEPTTAQPIWQRGAKDEMIHDLKAELRDEVKKRKLWQARAQRNRRLFRAVKTARTRDVRVCCRTIVQLGKRLQRLNYRVGEHPAFGGVAPVHSGRAHYESRALDVNTAPGISSAEQAQLRVLAQELHAIPCTENILHPGNDAGHADHLHVEWACP